MYDITILVKLVAEINFYGRFKAIKSISKCSKVFFAHIPYQAWGQVSVLVLKLGSNTEFSILGLVLLLDIYVQKCTCTCN